MARGGKKTRKSTPKQQTKRRTRRRGTKRSANNGQRSGQTFGSLVCKGIRSVLGVLPNAGITTSIADYIFKAMGWTSDKTKVQVGQALEYKDVIITGLCGAFELSPASFLGAVQTIGLISPAGNGNPEVANISTQWRTGRISLVKVVGRPSGPEGSVSGTWGIGIYPYRTPDSYAKIIADIQTTGVSFDMIRQCPVYQITDANKSLTLRKYMTPADGFSFQPQTLQSNVMIVLVAYQDMMRQVYSPLTAADFQCTIDCSATVIANERYPGPSYEKFQNQVSNPITGDHFVRVPSGVVCFANSTCVNNNGKCKISGVVQGHHSVNSELTLESMSIE